MTGWQLAKVAKQKNGAPTKHFLSMVREGLSQATVNLAKHFPSNHGHFINDNVPDGGHHLLYLQ